MKRILICLEKLDIGGVETSVISQATEYKRRGHKVFVLAKKGIYTEKLQEKGITCYEYDFKLEDKFFIEESKKIERIIKKEKVTEVHIHQYPCIIHLLPVLLKLNIPYIAFVHSIVDGTYEYFMNSYNSYKLALPLFFQNAAKIVVIREKEIEQNSKLFDIIDTNKYFLLKNSILFKEIPTFKKYPKKLTDFLLISRLSEEKLVSIKSGIEYFLNLKKTNPDIKLSILGDGPLLEKLKKNYTSESIIFLGKSTDVYKYIQENDVVIGVDRCILEAICNQRLAIISTYSGEITLVTSANISQLSKENFSGNNITETLKVELDLESLNYKEIVLENYNYAYKHFNISNNIYDQELQSPRFNSGIILFNYSNLIVEKLTKEQKENEKLFLQGQELYKKIAEYEKRDESLPRKIINKIIKRKQR